ncbi:hypothetical protein N9L06_04945 [Mariniblastus sp.]|nr:hypothetical protein [Mariniblastus sp.]
MLNEEDDAEIGRIIRFSSTMIRFQRLSKLSGAPTPFNGNDVRGNTPSQILEPMNQPYRSNASSLMKRQMASIPEPSRVGKMGDDVHVKSLAASTQTRDLTFS